MMSTRRCFLIFLLMVLIISAGGLAKAEMSIKDVKEGVLMHPETTVHLTYDNSCLYIGFECEEPLLDNIPKFSMWREGVEILLDTNHDRKSKTYFQVGITPGGKTGFPEHGVARMKFKLKDKIKIKTFYGEKCWFAEIAIPFESLGIKCPSPGTIWGIKLCRAHSGVYGSWPLLPETLRSFNPVSFADLHFEGKKDLMQPGLSSREIAIRKIVSPFEIDGKLKEDVWRESAKVPGFVLLPITTDARIKKQVPKAEILALIGEKYKEHGYTGMFTREDFELIKEYIKKYPWVGEAFERIKKDADYWASKSDEELYNFIPPENLRAYCPCYSFGCPICGTGNAAHTKHALATSLETPNMWKCKTCGRWWGPGEEIGYNGKKFKITDDGSGWTIPDEFPGSGHKCYFVASWRLYKLYTLFGSGRAITIEGYYVPKGAVGSLATAYAITGDSKYAHKALLILNRIAQLYPAYDGVIDIGSATEMMPHISWTTAGEEEIVDACAYSYNIVFDYLSKDKELIEFFKRKGQEDLNDNGQINEEDIRRNIAINLFGYMYEWLIRVREYSNADYVVGHAGLIARIGRTLENPDIVYEALEGKKGFRDLMHKLCYNDGRFFYNSLSYQFGQPAYFGRVGFATDGYCDGNKFKKPIDLFHDKSIIFERLVDYAYGIICNGRIPGIGDQTIPREKIDPSTGRSCIQSLAILISQYPWIAEGIENKDAFMKNIFDGIAKMQPRGAMGRILKVLEIEKIARKASFKPQASRLFTDTGLGILRTRDEGIEQVHAVLNYGIDGERHGHRDQLALNIIAYGYELTINKGYPFTWIRNPKTPEWTMGTKAQNVVRINGGSQATYRLGESIKHSGKLHAYTDNELMAVVDGSCEAVYPELADLYRRAIFLIKDPEYPFVVDVFNVAGGNTRDYQFHAQSDIEGKNFEIKFEDKAELRQVKKAPQYIDSRFMYDIEKANTKDSLTARWWIGDKDNTGLVLHMVKGGIDRTIITAKGQGEGSDKPVPCDPHLIVRETGKDSSQFVSVLFPYHGSVPKYTIEKLTSSDFKQGDKVVALRLTLNERTYLIFHDLEGKKKHSFRYGKHNYVFKGTCGVILEQNGKVKAMSLSRGELLGRDNIVVKAKRMKEGRVISIDEEEKSIIVKGIDYPAKLPCLLSWSDRAWTYRVIRVERIGNKLKMYLDTFSFEDGYTGNLLIQRGDKVFLISDRYMNL